MNERIRELAEQAGIFENLHTTQKFSELLVRECARVCRSQPNIYAHKGDRDNCAIAIEAHFGIEDKAEEFENWCKESDDGAAE